MFKEVRDVLTEYVKEIKNVRVYDIYFDPQGFEFLIKYLVEYKPGKVLVNVIHSNNPMITLQY